MIQITTEQKKLVEDNHNLIYSFLNRYHLSDDEYYGLAAIGLCKAAQTYSGDKSNFSTYAYKCMFTTVMHEVKRKSLLKTIPEHQILYYQKELNNYNDADSDLFLDYIPSKDNVENSALSEIILDEYITQLNDRDKKIIRLFREGYNQKQISKMIGCSRPLVSLVKKKLYEYLTG